MEEIPILFKLGGMDKRAYEVKKQIRKKWEPGNKDVLGGYCEWKESPHGFNVWVNSRQTNREIVESYFHEMTHALIQVLIDRKIIKRHRCDTEETLCRAVGYLSAQQVDDAILRHQ